MGQGSKAVSSEFNPGGYRDLGRFPRGGERRREKGEGGNVKQALFQTLKNLNK